MTQDEARQQFRYFTAKAATEYLEAIVVKGQELNIEAEPAFSEALVILMLILKDNQDWKQSEVAHFFARMLFYMEDCEIERAKPC